MKYNNLGNSGLYVSKVALGGLVFGQYIKSDKEAEILLNEALDSGINFVDTANVYNKGMSEEMLGRILKGKRDEIVLATKAHFSNETDPNKAWGSSRKGIMQSIEGSLKRLQTDYIDLYILHTFDQNCPLEESLSTMNDLVRSGKVRNIGVSNYTGWQMAKAQHIIEQKGYEKICSSQIHYNLITRDAEDEIIPAGNDLGIGFTIWGSLSGGFLTGKYTRDGQGEGRRKMVAHPPVNSRYCFDILDVVTELAEKYNTIPANISNAWLLHKKGINSVLLGVSSVEQLKSNIQAVEINLSIEDIKRLDDVSQPAFRYPHWATQSSLRGEYNMEMIVSNIERIKNNKRNSVLGHK